MQVQETQERRQSTVGVAGRRQSTVGVADDRLLRRPGSSTVAGRQQSTVGVAERRQSTTVGVAERRSYPRVSVVIPARNEARNLEHVLPFIPTLVDEIILVDGQSTDETVAVAQQLFPNIRILQQSGKGKGDALRTGFAACTGDIIVMLDADGSADPMEIPRFVETLVAGCDFAKGSRFIFGGGSHDITLLRRSGNSLLGTLVNLLFWTRFSDLCYGYNAFWKDCLDHIDIDCDGFEIETLLNLRMHTAHFKIVEVPSFEYSRIHGQSNLRPFRDGWRVLRTIMRERFRAVVAMPTSCEMGYRDVEKRQQIGGE